MMKMMKSPAPRFGGPMRLYSAGGHGTKLCVGVQEEHRGRGAHSRVLRLSDQGSRRTLVHGRRHDQRRPLHLFNRVDAVLDHGLSNCLVEAMGCRDHNVEARIVDGQRARLRQCVEEVEGCVLFPLLSIAIQSGRGWAREERFLCAFRPYRRWTDDRRPKGAVNVQRLEALVHLAWHLRVITDICTLVGVCLHGEILLLLLCPLCCGRNRDLCGSCSRERCRVQHRLWSGCSAHYRGQRHRRRRRGRCGRRHRRGRKVRNARRTLALSSHEGWTL
mmetsp:Transcript_103777/g.292718  ORF Transcript_103777/g.292718 Transcript_103777/m.292718 type:complete len:275 (+) Transcript_103777:3-827(+)